MKHLRLKIIISVYVCLISLGLYNAFHSYYSNISQAKQSAFSKLYTISNILGNQLDGDLHERLTKNFTEKDQIKNSSQDKDYEKLHKLLADVKSSSGLNTSIYTLFPSPDHQKFFFGVSSNDIPYYRHLYHTPPKELINNYNLGGFLDEYKDENGIWISAFSPIKNNKGEVVAVVQVDQNFKDFIRAVNKKLIGDISFLILIYAVIGFLLFRFLKEVLKKEENFIERQNLYNNQLEQEVSKRTEELNISNKKLIAVNKELESFFYSTSHDIRGPLCRIMGLSNLAKNEDDKQELVELIEIESLKMDNMLKKMILVNNLRTKTLNIESVSVFDTISDVLAQVKKKYNKSKAQVNIKMETQTLKIFESDQELLETIFVNLIDNAFKFSDPKNPKINISSFIDENGILSVSVGNNGLQFSKKELTHAFELFKNANNNKTDDANGIRLGLYTIKTAVDKLNGLVSIETTDQQMTEIKVLIPDFNVDSEVKEIIPFKEEINFTL